MSTILPFSGPLSSHIKERHYFLLLFVLVTLICSGFVLFFIDTTFKNIVFTILINLNHQIQCIWYAPTFLSLQTVDLFSSSIVTSSDISNKWDNTIYEPFDLICFSQHNTSKFTYPFVAEWYSMVQGNHICICRIQETTFWGHYWFRKS